MGYKSVLTKIDELREIVASWRNGEEPALIEKDMALERVKSIYEMLRFPSEEMEKAEAQVTEAQATQTPQPEAEAEEAAPEVEVELIFEEESEDVCEDVCEDVEAVEKEEEEEDLSLDLINVTNIEGENSEDSDMIDRESFLRELEAVSQKKRERLSKILSLYDDEMPESRDDSTEDQQQEVAQEEQPTTEDSVEPCTEESAEAEPSIEPSVELNEEQSEDDCTEQTAEQQPTEQETPEPPIQSEEAEPQTIVIESSISITSTLGINDRLLLLQELFGGDDELLVKTLEVLSMQPTIDDAMIYIAENHSWSGDNEGAQLLMSLLQTRYQS